MTMFLAIFNTRINFKFMYPKNNGGVCTYICLYLNWAYVCKCRYRRVVVHVALRVKIIVLNIMRNMVVFALVLVSVEIIILNKLIHGYIWAILCFV